MSSFLEIEDPDIIVIQETKIDRNILTSELFPDNFNYDVYRNDRTLNGGGVILLVNKTYNSMSLYNLENGSESVWAKIMFDGSPHFFGCWYKDPESPSDHIQLLVVRDSSVVRRHYIFLLEPWDVRELYIRKTADLPLRFLVGTFPRFVAIGFYFLSETLI